MPPDDSPTALGILGRQEILTILIFIVLMTIPVSAGITLYFVYTSPDVIEKLNITGDVNIGKFVDKVVESYDAFLVLLGVGVGGGTAAAIVRANRNSNI